jgi:hypothetical protein
MDASAAQQLRAIAENVTRAAAALERPRSDYVKAYDLLTDADDALQPLMRQLEQVCVRVIQSARPAASRGGRPTRRGRAFLP